MPFPKVSSRGIWLIGGIMAAGLFGWLAYSYQVMPPPENTRPKLHESETVRQDARIKITPQTTLVQKMVYVKCGDEEVLRTKPADNLVGLTLPQFQKVYNGWSIDHFDALEVRMSLLVDSLCREHANTMFIGVKDGYVAVFYGSPGPKAILKEMTKIPVDKLVTGDIAELEQGIVVQSKEELLRTLEGMQAR